MTILAIDPGKNTAIALSNGYTETLLLSCNDDIAKNISRVGGYLKVQFFEHKVTKLIIERPFFPPRCKGNAVDLTNAIIFEAHRRAYELQIPRSEFNSMKVRFSLLGRGKRIKGESLKAFDNLIRLEVEKYGFNPMNEHEADAAALICAYQKINHCEGVKFADQAPHNGTKLEKKCKNERNIKS